MQIYGDASLDAPNGSQIHCINLMLHLPLTLDVTFDSQCGLAFTAFKVKEGSVKGREGIRIFFV